VLVHDGAGPATDVAFAKWIDDVSDVKAMLQGFLWVSCNKLNQYV
jgi:hypothetical protein